MTNHKTRSHSKPSLFRMHKKLHYPYRQKALWLQVLKFPRSTADVSVKINDKIGNKVFIACDHTKTETTGMYLTSLCNVTVLNYSIQ